MAFARFKTSVEVAPSVICGGENVAETFGGSPTTESEANCVKSFRVLVTETIVVPVALSIALMLVGATVSA